MNETSKCYQKRIDNGDFKHYLDRINGIDIGCGGDLLKLPSGHSVFGWDQKNGDAQKLNLAPDNFYDFVYSSHCLEHMRDVPEALTNWVRVLKPGGHLYVVVPDFILYEKMQFPSRYNPDHKQTFSMILARKKVKRETHWHLMWDLEPLLNKLKTTIVSFSLEDDGFDYNVGPNVDQTLGSALAQIRIVAKKVM